jgi:hypothetical protein
MREIHATKKRLDFREYKNRSAIESDYELLIDEECLVYWNGELVVAYLQPEDKGGFFEPARAACRSIDYITDYRSNGMKTTSRIFGFEPRKTLRKDFCSATAMSWQQPAHHQAFLNAGKTVAEAYQKVNPDLYQQHAKLTEQKVEQDYKIEGSPFTSGIINNNNPLKYHFDRGNYRDVWSGMVTFRSGVAGGFLSCPEFGLGFALRDKTTLHFDGQGVLHGVTPLSMVGQNPERFTIVYYSLRQMWQCLPISEEVARIRSKRTNRENNRWKGIDPVQGDGKTS